MRCDSSAACSASRRGPVGHHIAFRESSIGVPFQGCLAVWGDVRLGSVAGCKMWSDSWWAAFHELRISPDYRTTERDTKAITRLFTESAVVRSFQLFHGWWDAAMWNGDASDKTDSANHHVSFTELSTRAMLGGGQCSDGALRSCFGAVALIFYSLASWRATCWVDLKIFRLWKKVSLAEWLVC